MIVVSDVMTFQMSPSEDSEFSTNVNPSMDPVFSKKTWTLVVVATIITAERWKSTRRTRRPMPPRTTAKRQIQNAA